MIKRKSKIKNKNESNARNNLEAPVNTKRELKSNRRNSSISFIGQYSNFLSNIVLNILENLSPNIQELNQPNPLASSRPIPILSIPSVFLLHGIRSRT